VIRVVLPTHLKVLAGVDREVSVELSGDTLGSALDGIEAAYPVLRGTFRDARSGRRRPFVRFYACEQDLSHDPPETVLPAAVLSGAEPLLVIGAMAGG
jgi:hypothetical protein